LNSAPVRRCSIVSWSPRRDRPCATRKLFHVAHVETMKKLAKPRPGVGLRRTIAIGLSGDGEARRGLEAGGAYEVNSSMAAVLPPTSDASESSKSVQIRG